MSGSSEFIGSELRLDAPKTLIAELREADMIDEAAAIETVQAAAQRNDHPKDNVISVIRNLRGNLYNGQKHREKPYLRQLGEAEEAMAILEEGYVALRAAHGQRLQYYAAQANEFLTRYPGSMVYQDGEGGWSPITQVVVAEPDVWHQDRSLYAQAGDQPLALLVDQIQCNRAALALEIEDRLAALDSRAED